MALPSVEEVLRQQQKKSRLPSIEEVLGKEAVTPPAPEPKKNLLEGFKGTIQDAFSKLPSLTDQFAKQSTVYPGAPAAAPTNRMTIPSHMGIPKAPEPPNPAVDQRISELAAQGIDPARLEQQKGQIARGVAIRDREPGKSDGLAGGVISGMLAGAGASKMRAEVPELSGYITAGEIAGSLLPFGVAYKAAGALTRGIVRPMLKTAATGALAGLPVGAMRGTLEGKDAPGIAKDALIFAGVGATGDVALRGIGIGLMKIPAVQKLVKRLTQANPTATTEQITVMAEREVAKQIGVSWDDLNPTQKARLTRLVQENFDSPGTMVADQFGNVTKGQPKQQIGTTKIAGLLPEASKPKEQPLLLPPLKSNLTVTQKEIPKIASKPIIRNAGLNRAISEYNQAIETIQNHFGTSELRQSEIDRILPELGIDIKKLADNIQKVEGKNLGLKPLAERSRLGQAAGVLEPPTALKRPLGEPLQFKRTIEPAKLELPKQKESSLSGPGVSAGLETSLTGTKPLLPRNKPLAEAEKQTATAIELTPRQLKRTALLEQQDRKKLLSSLQELSRAKGKMQPHYKEAAEELLSNIDTQALSMQAKNRIRTEKAQAFFDRMKAENPAYEIPESMVARLKRLDKKSIKDMSIEDVRDMQKAVDHIIHLNKTLNRLINKNKLQDLNEAVGDFVGAIRKQEKGGKPNANVLDLTAKTKTPGPITRFMNYAFKTNALDPETQVLRMTGNNENNLGYKYLYTDLVEGQRNKYAYQFKVDDYFDSVLEGINTKDWTGTKAKAIDIPLPGGRTIKMTKGERTSLYLHSLNSDNVAHIVDGGIRTTHGKQSVTLTKQDVKAIANSLTEDEKKVAQGVYEYLNRIQKDAINETSKMLDGFEIATVDNYMPLITDKQFMSKDYSKFKKKMTLEGFGFLKERTGGRNPIILEDVFRMIERTKEQVSNYHGFGVPLRNAKMILGNHNTKRAINDVFSYDDLKYFETLISQIDGNQADISTLESLGKKLLGNVQQAILGLNPWIWFKQSASLATASAEIDSKYLLAGAKKAAQWDKMTKYSPIIRLRRKGYVTRESGEIAELMADKQKEGSWTTKPIQTFDGVAISKIWNAVELEVKDKFPELAGDAFYNKVARRTEQIIYRTQPNYTTMQRSDIGRSDSFFVRVLTTFSTQRNKNYNLLYRGMMEAKQGNKKKGLKLASGVIAGTIAVTLIDTTRNIWKERDYSNSETFAKNMLGNLYFASAIYEMLAGGYDPSTPTDSAIADLGKAIKDLSEIEQGKKTVAGKLRSLAQAIGQVKGIPVTNVMRELDAAIKRYDPDLYYDWNELFYKQERGDYYGPLWSALGKGNDREVQAAAKRLKREGATLQTIESSGKSRGLNQLDINKAKKYLYYSEK